MSKYPVEMKSNLDGAVANLQAAKAALEAGQYDAAATRAADAAFHAGSMLLLEEGIEPSRHGDVITLLQKIFVQGRRLTKDQGANLSWLLALRKAEDRGTAAQINAEEARKAVEIAESFFAAAKVILDS